MEWRQVPGFSKYIVSENGDIMRVYNGGTKKILKKSKSKGGYVNCSMTNDDGYRVTTGIHRVVALAFIPNPQGYGIVRHKDGVLANNQVSNLEWGGFTDYERSAWKKTHIKS